MRHAHAATSEVQFMAACARPQIMWIRSTTRRRSSYLHHTTVWWNVQHGMFTACSGHVPGSEMQRGIVRAGGAKTSQAHILHTVWV